MKQPKYPVGWDEARVRWVLARYEQQSDDEAVAEDEAAYESTTHTAMEVPVDLVPAVRELLAKRRVGSCTARAATRQDRTNGSPFRIERHRRR
jgi:hypothetical protein